MRLIDADELEVYEGTINDWSTEQFVYKDDIDDAPTIENPIKDTLDKIRAEIEEYRDSLQWEYETIMKWDAINYILEQIIDKYRKAD